ncbi:MAG TPA: XrtA system polysaccharide deacetylase [Terriglobales bacterium]|nr:XrtA system polysaccharide deacetylase [Terriglobales bacterium]
MKMKNILSIDVEEWFQVQNLKQTISPQGWSYCEKRLSSNLCEILRLLEEKNAKATFFVLGWIAENFPETIKAIQKKGHEIGSHGFSHSLIFTQTEKEFREDVKKSLEIIGKLTDQPVLGYRAPSFSINSHCLWAFEVLSELGIKYDSSIFPIRHPEYGMPSAPRFPHSLKLKNGKELKEFPLSTVHFLGLNLPVAGGAYLRIFPYWYNRWGIKRLNSEGRSAIVYFHPWEIDPDQPREKIGPFKSFRHYTNLDLMKLKIKKLLEEFEFTSFSLSGALDA